MRQLQKPLVRVFFLTACACLLASCAAPPSAGPQLWQETDAGINELFFDDDGLWTSYRLAAHDRLALDNSAPVRFSLDGPSVSGSEQSAAVKELQKGYYFGPDPYARRELLQRETALLNGNERAAFGDDEYLGQPAKSYLGVITTFKPGAGGDTISREYPVNTADPGQGCSTQNFNFGPLDLGDDPPPGKGDNFTFFKEDMTTADYRSAVFGSGSDAGYGVVRKDLGGVDLSGFSLNNYLKEMNSPGSYQSSGDILPDALVLPHAHEYYGYARYEEDGAGNCLTTVYSDGNRTGYLQDTLQAMVNRYDGDPAVDWADFDSDGDQIIDLLGIIHAGYGFQEGGGEDRLNTSSSGLVTPVQVAGYSTPGDSSDDYYVQKFNLLPENLDVGAIQEEFEHQFGISDYYTVDASNSNGSWTSHSSGVWGGPLGGARPVGSGLHQAWLLGRKEPLIIDLEDIGPLDGQAAKEPLEVKLGRARYTPQDAEDGVIIRLPRLEVPVENLAGSGIGWYSGSGELLDNRLGRVFDLRSAEGQVLFSMDAWWDMEAGYDYLLVEFSDDDGRTWIAPDSLGGELSDQDEQNMGVVSPGSDWGLTGSGQGTLQWDLSGFKGRQVAVRISYLSDATGSHTGFMLDNILLADGSGILYQNDLESDFSDWSSAGWLVTPTAVFYERYYLLEWRDDNGFDQSLNDPYWIKYLNRDVPPPARSVDHLPATTPVLIIGYRDQSQAFDYGLLDDFASGNSIGPKYGHLVIDAHPFPQQWDTPDPGRANLVGHNMTGRVTPGDAGFGRVQTAPWAAAIDFDPDSGDSSEKKEWLPRSAVSAFHDSYGYYPGLFYDPGTDLLYLWDQGASAVVPGKGVYSTRVTDRNGDPQTDLYGDTVAGGMPLGSGNPGDDHKHYGLHVEVLESQEAYGVVRIWRSLYETRTDVVVGDIAEVGSSGRLTVEISENIGGKLEQPRVVVTLPDNVSYVEGSASGFEPHPVGQEVRRLTWEQNEAVGTGSGLFLGGFDVQRSGADKAIFKVDIYREEDMLVQSLTVEAPYFNWAVFMPLVLR